MKSEQNSNLITTVNADPLFCNIALYVRDACDLVVPEGKLNPPRLMGEVSDLRYELPNLDRESAGRQWLEWWKNVLVFQSQLLLGQIRPVDQRERSNRLTGTYAGVFDWPNFDSLQSKPELMRAAQVAFPSADSQDSDISRSPETRSRSSSVASAMVREVSNLHTELKSSNLKNRTIGFLVFAVEGLWTFVTEPGVICCSHAALSDKPRILSAIEQALFWPAGHNEELERHRTEPSTFRLPPSVIQRFALWSGPGFKLSCEQILPYSDGFEIEIQLEPESNFVAHQVSSVSSSPLSGRPKGQVDQFVGLALELGYADGRIGAMSESHQGEQEEILLTRFWRNASDPNTLWLWVSPLPPSGNVELRLAWESQGMNEIKASFAGNLLTTRSH